MGMIISEVEAASAGRASPRPAPCTKPSLADALANERLPANLLVHATHGRA